MTPHKFAIAAALSLLVTPPVMAVPASTPPSGTQPISPPAPPPKEGKSAPATATAPVAQARTAATSTKPAAPPATTPPTIKSSPPAGSAVVVPTSGAVSGSVRTASPTVTAAPIKGAATTTSAAGATKPATLSTPSGEKPAAEKPQPEKAADKPTGDKASAEKADRKPADKAAAEKPSSDRKAPARRTHRTPRRARGPLDPAREVRLLPSADSFIALVDATRTEARPLVLHFWASWCELCKGELPSLGDAFQQLEESGLRVLVVSLDDPAERNGPVRRFLDQHDIAGERYLLDTYDPALVTSRIDPAWKGELPATFVLKEGRQVFRYIGPMEELKPLMEAIDAADGVEPGAAEEPSAAPSEAAVPSPAATTPPASP